MKKETYRDKRKVNIKTSALLGIFLYIVAVLFFDMILGWIDTSQGYPYFFGLIELLVVSAGLLFFSWNLFKNASQETAGGFFKYLICQMLPLIVMTIIAIILTYKGTDGSFTSNWNVTSWIIAPTTFFYLPYGFLFKIIDVIPFTLFMPICLIYMGLLQYAGFALGSGSRKYLRQREEVLQEKTRENKANQNQMAKEAAQRIEEQKQAEEQPVEAPGKTQEIKAEETKKPQNRHEVLGDIEGQAIIETEAIGKITDEMIEEAMRQRQIKDREAKIAEARAKRRAQEKAAAEVQESQNKEVQNLNKEIELLRQKLNRGKDKK